MHRLTNRVLHNLPLGTQLGLIPSTFQIGCHCWLDGDVDGVSYGAYMPATLCGATAAGRYILHWGLQVCPLYTAACPRMPWTERQPRYVKASTTRTREGNQIIKACERLALVELGLNQQVS